MWNGLRRGMRHFKQTKNQKTAIGQLSSACRGEKKKPKVFLTFDIFVIPVDRRLPVGVEPDDVGALGGVGHDLGVLGRVDRPDGARVFWRQRKKIRESGFFCTISSNPNLRKPHAKYPKRS